MNNWQSQPKELNLLLSKTKYRKQRDGKYNKQDFDQAINVLEEMIACKEQCEDPVCPPDGPCHVRLRGEAC